MTLLSPLVIGPDWKFGNSDGGPGGLGTVLDVKQDGKVVVSMITKTHKCKF